MSDLTIQNKIATSLFQYLKNLDDSVKLKIIDKLKKSLKGTNANNTPDISNQENKKPTWSEKQLHDKKNNRFEWNDDRSADEIIKDIYSSRLSTQDPISFD